MLAPPVDIWRRLPCLLFHIRDAIQLGRIYLFPAKRILPIGAFECHYCSRISYFLYLAAD